MLVATHRRVDMASSSRHKPVHTRTRLHLRVSSRMGILSSNNISNHHPRNHSTSSSLMDTRRSSSNSSRSISSNSSRSINSNTILPPMERQGHSLRLLVRIIMVKALSLVNR
jgi:hypothetical protein